MSLHICLFQLIKSKVTCKQGVRRRKISALTSDKSTLSSCGLLFHPNLIWKNGSQNPFTGR